MDGQLLFLGTGGSAGVPMVGCHCEVCRSMDPHNKRLRTSALVTWKGKKLLIDSGPDFRFQALKYDLHHLDGVLLTHAHYDHIAGMDELRAYYLIHRQVLEVLLSKSSYKEIKQRFPYLFRKKSIKKSLPAQLEFTLLENERGKVCFQGLSIDYMTYEQGGMKVNGFRFGSLAYISDISYYPDSIFDDLKGIEILVVSALREEPSPVHFSIDEAVLFSKKVGARKTFFTHIAHEMDHEIVSRKLPSDVFLAFDGLRLEFF